MRQHIIFGIAALILGAAYVFLTPPFDVPDEVGHYWRASSIAYGYANADRPMMPRGFRIIVWLFFTPTRDLHMTAEKLRLGRGVQLEPFAPVPLRVPSYYSPAAYVPQIGAAFVTRIVAARPFFGFYAGRLAALLASIALVMLAGLLAPEFRDHLHAVALLPMSLFLFASWSADAMTIAAAFLTSALLLRAIRSETTITTREMVLLACASIWLSLCKPSYALIALLALLIPRRRFVVVLLALVIAASIFSVSLTMSTAVTRPRSDIPVDAHAQLQFIKDDPQRFAAVLIRDLRQNGVDYIQSMIGRFGLYDVPLPNVVVVFFLALLAAVGLVNGPPLPLRVRFLALLIVAVIVFSILTYLYLTSSIAGGTTIEGPQGRYILPVLPLLLTLIRVPQARLRVPHELIILAGVLGNAVSIAVLFQRYW